MGKKGKVFVVSAPSGAGKSTLCSYLRKEIPSLSYSVSYTTRGPRKGEKDGQDYFFIDREEFERRIKEDKWAEWADVHGNFYGTSKGFLKRATDKGTDILLEIDVQGAKQIKEKFPEAVLVFILPPSVEELKNRLVKRNTDSKEVIEKRMAAADHEIAQSKHFDYKIINDVFEEAADQLVNLVINGKIDV